MQPTPQVKVFSEIVDTPIDPQDTIKFVTDDRAGAVVSFQGMIRNHDDGREVTGIEYTAHPDVMMMLTQATLDVGNAFPVYALAVQHRIGKLEVGEIAMHASVSAAHRAEAFQACAALIDHIKNTVPIWKNQQFPGEGHEWVGTP